MGARRWWILIAVVFAIGCKRKEAIPPRGERWAQVERWARPTVEAGDPALIERAIARIAGDRDKVDEAWREIIHSSGSEETPVVEFDGRVQEAVEALVAWRAAGGGLPRTSCASLDQAALGNVFPLLALARAALLSSGPDAADPRVEAALYLGHRLRGEGATLIEVAVGAAIADAAVDWAEAYDAKPGAAFRALAPAEDTERRAMAAEIVCTVAMAENASADPRMRRELGADPTREIEKVRWFGEETVHGANALMSAPDKLESYLAERSERAREQNDWKLLKLLAPASTVAAKMRRDRRRYVELLARGD